MMRQRAPISVTDHTDTLPFGSRLYDAADTEKISRSSARMTFTAWKTRCMLPRGMLRMSACRSPCGFRRTAGNTSTCSRPVRSGRVTPSRGISALSGQFREMADRYHAAGNGAAGFRRCHRQAARGFNGGHEPYFWMWCGWLIRKGGEILQLNADGTFSDRVLPCSPVWNHGKRCSRCISCRCMEDKTHMSKLELTDECAYQLISRYLVVDGRECVLELGSRLSDSVWVTSGRAAVPAGMPRTERIFIWNPVTGAYGRRYPRGPAARAGKGGGTGGDRH